MILLGRWTVYFIANINSHTKAFVALLYRHTIVFEYRLGALFEDGGFEIYEATTKTYVENEICDIIGGPDQGSLMMHNILDHVKTCYYEMSDYMVE